MTLESSVSDLRFMNPPMPRRVCQRADYPDGVLLGVIAFQLDTQRIYDLAGDNTGLGVTGETLLAKLTNDGGAVFVAPLRHDPQGRHAAQDRPEVRGCSRFARLCPVNAAVAWKQTMPVNRLLRMALFAGNCAGDGGQDGCRRGICADSQAT